MSFEMKAAGAVVVSAAARRHEWRWWCGGSSRTCRRLTLILNTWQFIEVQEGTVSAARPQARQASKSHAALAERKVKSAPASAPLSVLELLKRVKAELVSRGARGHATPVHTRRLHPAAPARRAASLTLACLTSRGRALRTVHRRSCAKCRSSSRCAPSLWSS